MPRIALAVCGFLSISLLGLHAVAEEAPTICGVSLADVPSTLDDRELPDLYRLHPQEAGKVEFIIDEVLVMPIYGSQPYAVLYYPCRQERFYIEVREENKRDRFYGPIDGDPFQQLNLETSMRSLLRSADEDPIFRYSESTAAKRANLGTVTVNDPNDALQRLGELIARGDDKLRALGFSMVKELPVPKYNSRHLLTDLEKTLDRALPEIGDAATRRFGKEARAYVAELTATAVKDWNARRVLLPDEEYQAGNDGDAPGEIVWGEVDATSGLQVGVGLAKADSDAPVDLSASSWAFGETKVLTVWVRRNRSHPAQQ